MPVARFASLLLIVALSACGQPVAPSPDATGQPPAVVQPDAPPPVPDPAQVSTLAGAWRVAGIDGRSFDEPYGLALTGDDQQLWWDPRCAGFARGYRIEGRRIAFVSTRPPAPAGSPPPPVCSIGVPPRLDEVFRALDGAVSVTRTAGNGVLISGPDHSVTLFSQ